MQKRVNDDDGAINIYVLYACQLLIMRADLGISTGLFWQLPALLRARYDSGTNDDGDAVLFVAHFQPSFRYCRRPADVDHFVHC